MSDIVERLQRWRDEDHSDKLILTRHEAITLLEEIKWLRDELDFFGLPKTDYKR